MFDGIIRLLGSALDFATAIFKRKNDPDMVANKRAEELSKQKDEIAALEARAAAGDPAALEEIRRRVAE